MMQTKLTEIELSELKLVQRNVSGSDYIKVTCILMLQTNVSPKDISEYLGIDTSTVYRYANQYATEGITGYLDNNCKGYWGLLSSGQLSLLRKELKEHFYTDSRSVTGWIASTFGPQYRPQCIVDLLTRKPKKQELFVRELSEIISTMDDESVVYYAEDVHPTHNSHSTYA
jgi:transposase